MATKKRKINQYFSGFINLKTDEKDRYKKHFVQLAGQELLVFENELKAKMNTISDKISMQNVEKIETNLKSVTTGRQASFPTISITYRPGNLYKEVRIRAENADEQTKLLRYLRAVALYLLPQNTESILPGQYQELVDIIEKTKKNAPAPYQDTYLNESWSTPSQPQSPAVLKPNRPVKLHSIDVPSDAFRPSSPNLAPSVPFKPPAFYPSLDQRQMSSPNLRRHQSDGQYPIGGYSTSPVSHPESFNNDDTAFPPVIRSAKQSWFVNESLTREEAEDFLTKNKDYGNMIVRRRAMQTASDDWEFAVSIKTGNSNQPFKHYRLKKLRDKGINQFIIHLNDDIHPPLYTMDEVVNYIIKRSTTSVIPMKIHGNSNVYESSIHSNHGERGSGDHSHSATYENHDGVDYNNVTTDMKRALKSATLPNRQTHDGKYPLMPRHTSPAIVFPR